MRAGADQRVQQSLDVVRVTGNNAVHPGTIDFNDSADVSTLFELINYITDTLITRPKKTREMFDNLPEEDKKRIKKKGLENLISALQNSPIIFLIGHYWRFSEETKKLDPVFMRFGFRANFKKNIR